MKIVPQLEKEENFPCSIKRERKKSNTISNSPLALCLSRGGNDGSRLGARAGKEKKKKRRTKSVYHPSLTRTHPDWSGGGRKNKIGTREGPLGQNSQPTPRS